MLDAYLYHGMRSAFGKHAGKLANIRADDLAASVLQAVVSQSGFAATDLEDVILGCSNQAGEDSRNVARHASLLAGFPVALPGQTVNRLCASGLAAVLDAARAVSCREGALYLAGGVENMSRAPFVLGKAEAAFSRDAKIYDTTLGCRFPNSKLTEYYGAHSMPETGDEVAKQFQITRTEADIFAAASQEKFERARKDGFIAGEIAPVSCHKNAKTPSVQIVEDEHPRADSNFEALQKLRPLFDGGVVTAGNASGINDGAAAILVGSRSVGEAKGIRPRGRVLSGAASGVEPRIMGVGPVLAIHKALERANLTLAQMDVIEINEAFAPQVLSCLKLLEIDFADSRVNPNGGAIAVGHPLGASGTRLVLTALRQLERTQGRYAVVSLCIGVGQGLAVVLERV